MKDKLIANELWTERMNQQLESGLSIRAWCRKEAIAYSTFLYWKRKLFSSNEMPSTLPQWVEITNPRTHHPLVESPSVFTLSYQDYKLQIPEHFSAGALQEVLQVLKNQC